MSGGRQRSASLLTTTKGGQKGKRVGGRGKILREEGINLKLSYSSEA